MSTRPREYLGELLGADVVAEELGPSWNVAPGATLYAAAGTRRGRRLGVMRWGLVPSWATSPDEGPRPINARAESLLDKPVFAEALRRRRCIVPVDGFYEWERLADGSRQPWFFSAPDGAPLALAGLWNRWRSRDGDGAPLVTCTIITTAPNDVVAPLHDRMPAVLDRDRWDAWLGPGGDLDEMIALLRPAPEDSLYRARANRRANSTANDDPELLSA